MRELTVKQLFEDKRKDFALSLVTEPQTIDKKIVTPYFNRPGLALAGWLEVFTPERIQIFGEAEVRYLQSLPEKTMLERLRELFKMDIPCVIISKGLSLPPSVEYLANDLHIPIFSSRLSTVQLISQINRYLMDVFALEKTIHATLVDVFGLGILIPMHHKLEHWLIHKLLQHRHKHAMAHQHHPAPEIPAVADIKKSPADNNG